MKSEKGITLLEVLISAGVAAILGTLISLSLIQFRSSQNLDSEAKAIGSILRNAQQRAITQENIGMSEMWGVHFENPTSGEDFYELFKGTSYPGTLYNRSPLRSTVEFSNIGVGSSKNIMFANISGKPVSADTIELRIKGSDCIADPSKCQSITVNGIGVITF